MIFPSKTVMVEQNLRTWFLDMSPPSLRLLASWIKLFFSKQRILLSIGFGAAKAEFGNNFAYTKVKCIYVYMYIHKLIYISIHNQILILLLLLFWTNCLLLDQLGEGDSTPLQYSCLENPMDGGAWWAVVHGVAKSQTRLKQLSSSSSRIN